MSPSPLALIALALLTVTAPSAYARTLDTQAARVVATPRLELTHPVATAGRALNQVIAPSCDQVNSGEACNGPVSVFGQPTTNRTCIKTVSAAADQCSGSLLNLLAGVLHAESAASSTGTCEVVPCCDDAEGATECLDVELGCLAGLKLCLGGAVGNLLATLLGNSISIVIGPSNPVNGTVPSTTPPLLPAVLSPLLSGTPILGPVGGLLPPPVVAPAASPVAPAASPVAPAATPVPSPVTPAATPVPSPVAATPSPHKAVKPAKSPKAGR